MRRSPWLVLLFSVLGEIALVALGIWQLQRLAWKENLLAQLDAASAAEAVPLNRAIERFQEGVSIAYMKVKARGSFSRGEPLRLLTTVNGGPAWTLVHGFEPVEGKAVLANRGKLPHGRPLPAADGSAIEIFGFVHWHNEGRGLFDVDNRPEENLWYWWDVAAMAGRFPATRAAPPAMVLDLLPGSPGTEGLVVSPPRAVLRNNHLGYAITWFGMAVVLAVISGLFLLRLHREAANGAP
jgi:surfeit locus 1 family protein